MGRARIARAWVPLGSVGCGARLARGPDFEDHQALGTEIRGYGMAWGAYASQRTGPMRDWAGAGPTPPRSPCRGERSKASLASWLQNRGDRHVRIVYPNPDTIPSFSLTPTSLVGIQMERLCHRIWYCIVTNSCVKPSMHL